MKLTKDMLAAMIPTNKNPDAWFEALVDILPKYNINTPERIAGFIAQCAHESMDFTALEENLNYSEKSLLAVFGRYFGPGKRNAAEYARNPEKIANYVYQDEFRKSKMGNVKPGDGWRFRGRGLKQLTGRDNYTAFGKTVGMTAEEAAEYVATPKGAVESACWFWNTNNLNKLADAQDIVGLTKRINGGDIGLADRTARWKKALAILGGQAVPAAPKASASTPAAAASGAPRTLKKGSRGEDVIKMQKAMKLNADGVFGSGTEAAVKAWQAKNGLVADGVMGPKSLAKLYG